MNKQKIDEAFVKLISLYDTCDGLENNGDDKSANEMRKTLNDLSKFIVSLMKDNTQAKENIKHLVDYYDDNNLMDTIPDYVWGYILAIEKSCN
jgi:hypothetical protein